MNRSWPIWLILIVCALSILGALGWQTQRTLSMERDRLQANAKAKVEERVRLALSRMDTAASAMLVIENQRPPEYYQPFYQPQVIFTNTLQTVDGKLVTQPSPLLSDPPEFIQLHFEVWAHRDMTSPQVPIGNHRDLAEASGIASGEIETSTQRLRELHRLLNAPAAVPPQAGQKTDRSLQSSFRSSMPPVQAGQSFEVDLPGMDNFTVMVQVAQNGQRGWNVMPVQMPEIGSEWNNKELNELVANSYNEPQEQSAYQQDLNKSERYKRQKVLEEVQYRAAKEAVYSKSMAKNSDAVRRDANGRVDDDRLEEDNQIDGQQALLVNPSSSLNWSGQRKENLSHKGPKIRIEAPSNELGVSQFLEQKRFAELVQAVARAYKDSNLEWKDNIVIGVPASDVVRLGSAAEIVDIDVTPFRPLWLEGELLVVRQVRSESGMRYQGFWIDSEAMSRSLLDGISDLLPNAKLKPIAGHQSQTLEQGFMNGEPLIDDRSMVTLPWRLDEGVEVNVDLAGFTPLHTSLGIGWIAVILAMVAAAMLVRGVLRMSERRAAFVSSVTHELRTPLTTFQLYSDLLAEGMVPEGEKRQNYLKTMRLEAGRLNHLIENVLSYSRIERGSARAHREKLSVASLVGRFESRLGTRVQRDHARFEVHGLREIRDAEVETDVTAVEQIVSNLVDNACKYGLPEDGEAVIRLSVHADRKWVRLSVCDSGKGIRRGDHHKLFRPFHKSAHDAAETKPGVGLGLALCRRLARALGGNLTVDSKRDKGACFELKLPRVQA